MHDDHTVAFTVLRPWPEVRRQRGRPVPWRWGSPFVNIAGRELYFPPLITVWHVEPNNGDTRPQPCGDPHWRRHVRHWKFQVHPLQTLRRRALTRCEWCHGRSTKTNPVNVSHQWDRERGPWWRGETGLFHSLCSGAHTAARTCLCDHPVFDHNGYGRCARCMRHRSWMTPERTAEFPPPTLIYLAGLEPGQRPDPERVRALRGDAR